MNRWWRRLFPRPCDPGPSVDLPDPTEAQQALRDSTRRRQETEDQVSEVRGLGARLRQAREENHFARDIARALRGSG